MGRPRKVGRRETSGKLQRPTLAQIAARERDRQEEEMAVVLAQPHRRGDRHQWRASAIGRFTLNRRLRSEIYEAAVAHAATVRRWRAAKGVPTDQRGATSGGISDGPSDAAVRAWGVEIARVETAIARKVGRIGLSVLKILVLEDRDIDPLRHAVLARALAELAVLTDFWDGRGHPHRS